MYTKQSKLKVVKLIELNYKCKTAASCKDIIRCSIRRNSADRYAYENISSVSKSKMGDRQKYPNTQKKPFEGTQTHPKRVLKARKWVNHVINRKGFRVPSSIHF